MATQVAYSRGGPWKAEVRAHLGRLVLRATAVNPIGPVPRTHLDDTFDWLNDPTRPGHYSYQYGTKVDPNSYEPLIDNLRFYFDDVHTAFEFKVRWG